MTTTDTPTAAIDLETRGSVHLLRMRDGENRFNRAFVDGFHRALDTIESTTGPAALVVTGEGKFFSNGLDLEWMGDAGADDVGFLDDVHRLLGRVLRLDVVTVAAVNGHAFAAGAMLASAHDFRIMREDRGFWCVPEVDLGLPLTPEMFEVLDAHVPRPALAEAALTGRRYSGPDALEAGIVDQLASENDVLDIAVAMAADLATKDRMVVREHKALLYGSLLTTR